MAEPEETSAQETESDRLDPWMEDGNVVLTAQGKHFRVHRSILTSYSEVFKGMFDTFPESAEKEFIEECPVIHLHDPVTDDNCVVQSSCVCNIRRLGWDDVAVAQPFGPWLSEWDNLFCDECQADLNAWRNTAIQATWNDVPMVFGFESWTEVAQSGDFPSLK